jgi:drug/metabolite transporter (DMT)-like permease
VGVALVMAGIAMVLPASASGTAPRGARLRGVLFGLAAVVCMTASTLAARTALTSASPMHATLVRMTAGTVAVLAVGAATGRLRSWAAPFRNVDLRHRFVVAVAVVTFGGFWLSLVALKNVDVATANTLGSTEPLFAVPLAAVFLGERPTLRGVSGCVVASAGMVVLCLG